ncbi:MAG TPA: restriction endonuclease [Tepidisphaeraceae bacterium]
MSRKSKSSVVDDAFGLLKLTPVWVGPLLAVVVFFAVRFLLPVLLRPGPGGFDPGLIVRPAVPAIASFAALAVLLIWAAAEAHKFFGRRLLDRQDGIEDIRRLSWEQFERLVAEAYRRRGYVAEVVGSTSGDGGVDVELTARGERVLVQCKQWRAYRVGVRPVRELLSVVVSRQAIKGVLVTSGPGSRRRPGDLHTPARRSN